MGSKTNAKLINVAITDDHAIFKQGLKLALSKYDDLNLVLEADNGLHLIKQLENTQPDVILLDLRMSVMNGLDTLRHIKRRFPDIKVIVLSLNVHDSTIKQLMDLGASSFLSKTAEPKHMYRAIKTCYEKERYIDDMIENACIACSD